VRTRRIITLAVLFACGQTTAMGDRAERATVVRTPTVVRSGAKVDTSKEATEAAPQTLGPLDNTAALKHLFEALGALDDGTADTDVRIVQYGDSHTAADMMTGIARRALQARFGDGGRGFVAIGRPWRAYWQDGVHSPGMTHDWNPEHGKIDHGHYVGDGCYGLGGVALVTSGQGARAWSEIAAPSSNIEVDYWEQPQGGSLDIIVDGKTALTIHTRGAQPASAFKSMEVPDGPHKIEMRAHGDGEVRVFGVTLDRAQVGVVYDALGINGARASTTLRWNEAHLQEQLRHRAPKLVVLAYGTNESADDGPLDQVERQLVDVLGRVARAVPTASCLVMGPPDRAVASPSDNPYGDKDAGAIWSTSPKLVQVVAVERRVAGAAGCAFYDQLSAMGGPGTIAAWAEADPPRAQRDRTHLTRDGYALLGNAFAADILAAYGAWRLEHNLPPAKVQPVRPVLPPMTPPDDVLPLPNTQANAPFVAIPL
jgi:lysophospholipase L1-like esterase